ncbi:MAG: hypothetical protein HY329_02690 [Chloroflexi bacterium]|nr:hypothetical protein [Chloroflexota bacterium]
MGARRFVAATKFDIASARLSAMLLAQIVERGRRLLAAPEDWTGMSSTALRSEGLLFSRLGRWSEAEAAFFQAIDLERAHGFPYNEAHILVPWAELYFQRNEPGDRERGLEKLYQALGIFERCAAKNDVEKALARRVAVG